jgi:hypothetical protein
MIPKVVANPENKFSLIFFGGGRGSVLHNPALIDQLSISNLA